MAGFAAQGATFTFDGTRGQFGANVTSLSVSSPEAEVVDMTGPDDALGLRVMVPTGDWSGGSVEVEYIASPSGADPEGFVRDYGTLTFAASGVTISRRAILASTDKRVSVGDIVRGSLRFTLTDYEG